MTPEQIEAAKQRLRNAAAGLQIVDPKDRLMIAALALQALIRVVPDRECAIVAEAAVNYADALLAHLARPTPSGMQTR